MAMWYVNAKFPAKKIESALPQFGFTVRASGGVARVEKYNCGAEFRKAPDGDYQMTELPAIMKMGQFTQLWDAGYQKFLITKDKSKLPVIVSELGDLRKFNEELRSALGVPTYYNEALGSTCAYTVYDRVKGRMGDVPDETVGAHSVDEEE
ncbi:MAG: hypothetical protein ACYC92_01165 [Candidatus Acidiferrales bacterium]